VLAEFGDDPHRYRDGKARRNYAGTSPVTRASGKKKVVAARHVHNDRLVDALNAHAFAALTASPGARACYDELRARGTGHHDALRRLANRLVGILTAASKPARSTTKTPPGATASKLPKPRDNLIPWDV
jgi:Transposase IS116/IS110/IS902 family